MKPNLQLGRYDYILLKYVNGDSNNWYVASLQAYKNYQEHSSNLTIYKWDNGAQYEHRKDKGSIEVYQPQQLANTTAIGRVSYNVQKLLSELNPELYNWFDGIKPIKPVTPLWETQPHNYYIGMWTPSIYYLVPKAEADKEQIVVPATPWEKPSMDNNRPISKKGFLKFLTFEEVLATGEIQRKLKAANPALFEVYAKAAKPTQQHWEVHPDEYYIGFGVNSKQPYLYLRANSGLYGARATCWEYTDVESQGCLISNTLGGKKFPQLSIAEKQILEKRNPGLFSKWEAFYNAKYPPKKAGSAQSPAPQTGSDFDVDKTIHTLLDLKPNTVIDKSKYKEAHLGYNTVIIDDTQYLNNKNQQPTNSKKMNLKQLLPNFEFGKLATDKLALSFNGIAFKKGDGSFVVFDLKTKTLIDCMDMTFDVDFYRMPTPKLQAGDITELDGAFYIVEKVNEDGSFTGIVPTTGTRSNKLARNNVFGMFFYTKIVSIFNMFGEQGGQNANPFGTMNPMMLMMMNKDGDGKSGGMGDMMEMMLMSQMFGGQQGANPFANMFGAQPFQQPAQDASIFTAPANSGTPDATKRKSKAKTAAGKARAAAKGLDTE